MGVRILLVATLLFTFFTLAVFIMSLIGKRPMIIFPAIFFLTFFIMWSVLGNKTPDVVALRHAYSNRLHAYLGDPFVMGGEAETGVDCSGLARASLWQAMVRQGIKEFNARLLGTTLWDFWWHDVDAADIAKGIYGYTKVVGYTDKLAGYDTSDLKVGDMAVSELQHVMIYCGDGKWIEASPIDKKVVINKAPATSKRTWFNKPVMLIRWWILDNK
jgi:hypothetical protein